MVWVCVDADGSEHVIGGEPHKCVCPTEPKYSYWVCNYGPNVKLPKGSIKKLIGRELTFEDEPVELKEE